MIPAVESWLAVLVAILSLSFVTLVMFMYLYLGLHIAILAPAAFVEKLRGMIRERRFEDATALCGESGRSVYVAPILRRVLENREQGHAALVQVVGAECRLRAEPIHARVRIVFWLGVTGLVLGLGGAVGGFIHVWVTDWTPVEFQEEFEYAMWQAMLLAASGIGFVLMGLVLYGILRARAGVALGEMEHLCQQLADETARCSVTPSQARIRELADAARKKIAQSAAPR